MGRAWFAAIVLALAACVSEPSARAQGFGLSALLNPEGSRLFPQLVVYPRHAGKPDTRWRDFKWKYVDYRKQRARFRLFFYEEEAWTAKFALPEIEQEMEYLGAIFNYTPEIPFSYLLF